MDASSRKLKKELKRAGLSDHAIEAAWPSWWSDDAAASPSARAELRFTLARRLGLAPRPLLGERVEFVWRDDARFKGLPSFASDMSKEALTSFGMAVTQHLLRATSEGPIFSGLEAREIRRLLIDMSGQADLQGLLALCWGIGIPVIHLRVFPLTAKNMHAMVVRSSERFAILLGKDAMYPAPVAFTLAHELGHVALGHLAGEPVLVDLDDVSEGERDPEEIDADRFSLEVLTGSPAPDFLVNKERYNSVQLADAALRVGLEHGIEPGTLALCLAYRTQSWPVAMKALQLIYDQAKPVWREVNGVAATQLNWDDIADDVADYLRSIMGL